jgi:hypothetical protein
LTGDSHHDQGIEPTACETEVAHALAGPLRVAAGACLHWRGHRLCGGLAWGINTRNMSSRMSAPVRHGLCILTGIFAAICLVLCRVSYNAIDFFDVRKVVTALSAGIGETGPHCGQGFIGYC